MATFISLPIPCTHALAAPPLSPSMQTSGLTTMLWSASGVTTSKTASTTWEIQCLTWRGRRWVVCVCRNQHTHTITQSHIHVKVEQSSNSHNYCSKAQSYYLSVHNPVLVFRDFAHCLNIMSGWCNAVRQGTWNQACLIRGLTVKWPFSHIYALIIRSGMYTVHSNRFHCYHNIL